MTFIEGRDIKRHPLGSTKVWRKTATVLAGQAGIGGVVSTPEGDMSYEAGDFIVTDNPPTHCWPVKRDVFLATYVEDEEP